MLSHFSHVWLFVTPWTVVHQAPLSIWFSRQEYWSGWPWLPSGIFQIWASNPHLLHLLHWLADSLLLVLTWKPKITVFWRYGTALPYTSFRFLSSSVTAYPSSRLCTSFTLFPIFSLLYHFFYLLSSSNFFP